MPKERPFFNPRIEKCGLGRRPGFSPEAWREYGPAEEVLWMLETIRKEIALPNHNFLPADPLALLISSGDDRDDVYSLIELERRYGVRYKDEEIERIRREDWTLGQFVNDLLMRAKTDTSA